MANKQVRNDEGTGNFALPEPCEDCEPNGGNWSHSLRHHEFNRFPATYEMAGRCHCARGHALAEMDCDRAAGRTPVGAQIDQQAEERKERQKWARWKRKHYEETAQASERIANLNWGAKVIKQPRLVDIHGAKEFAERANI